MEASQYFRLNRKILLHLQIFKYSDTAYPMNRFLECSRFYPNIKFSIVKFTPKNDLFWTDYGEDVEELTFNSCLINKPEFLHIIRLCPNLRMLSITRCEDLFKTWSVVKKLSQVRMKFPHMRTLTFNETSLMTKAIFNFMVASSPNITSLTLANCFGNTRPRDRVLILESLIDFISSRPKQIKALNLTNTPTDELFLLKLADIELLKLHELRFTFNGVVATTGRSGVVTLLRNQTELKILDVTESKGLSNFCLGEICKYQKGLRKLIIKKCWLINDGGLKDVSKLLDLELLDVSSCDRITDGGIIEGLVPRGKKILKLKELYLGLLPYMSILAIYRLTQQYDELEVLDLSGSSNSITDEALQMIFRYQRKLKYVNFDCCAKITDFGITGLTDAVEHGNFKHYSPYNLNKLPDLRYINLGGCYHLTDKSFINAFDLPELKEINLSRCQNVTEIGLSELCRKCPRLETIDLSECFNVKDTTVQMITSKIVHLETLKLNGCTQITCGIFEDIAINCKYLKVRLSCLRSGDLLA
jgi:F-box and leucine-rich repeat protein 9